MTSNREWLYSLDVADLSDWLDAEHESCAQHPDQPKRPETQDCGSDSREKLEADVQKWCGRCAYQFDMVYMWLNRQVAITSNAMRGKIDELTAERDELREKNRRQRKQLFELQNAIHERNEGTLKRQWKQQVEELKAEAMRNRDGVESLTAERDAYRERFGKALDLAHEIGRLAE